jgi:periplasmic copper chaperone A
MSMPMPMLAIFRTVCVSGVSALACISGAFAHITLETREAPVGSSYKAVLRVPHGCDGSATVALRVRIPEGFLDVKPMPKAGWTLKVTRGGYPKAMSLRGVKVSEGVTEVAWSGGHLPDAYYDEFVLTGYLSNDLLPDQSIYFAIVQECEKGVNRWIATPAAGQESAEPAAGLKLLPNK